MFLNPLPISAFGRGPPIEAPCNWSAPTNSGRSYSPFSIKGAPNRSPLRMGQPSRDTHQRPMFALHKIIELCFSRTLRALRAEKVEPCVAAHGGCAKNSNPPSPRSVKSAFGRRRRKNEFFDLEVFLGNRFFQAWKFSDFSIGLSASPKF